MVTKGVVVSPERGGNDWVSRLLDLLLIGFTYWLPLAVYPDAEWRVQETIATVAALIIYNVAADATGLYRASTISAPGKVELGKVWLAWGLTPPVLLTLAFATKTTESYSRMATTLWFVLAPSLLCLVRLSLRRVRGELFRRGVSTRTVHIVGATKMGSVIAERLIESESLGMRVDGYFDDRDPERLHPMPESLGGPSGSLATLVEMAKAGEADIVYITLPLRAESRISEMVRKLADTTASVYVVADFMVFDLAHAQWSNIQGIPVVSVFESPFYGVNGWLKRVEDVVLGSIIMCIIALPMLAIAIAVKVTSRGPVFFRQRRYGLNGEEIRVLKFRSMTVTEDGPEVKQATKNDQRITPLGGFLRRTSLDELPQFINVIMGEMSIVGPRPHAVAHNEMYRKMIHGYMLRHKVKPGITGWAQVNGWRGETDTLEKMEQRVNHDLHYIQNWGLLFDIKIIFKTVFGSGTRQNAY